MKKVLCLLLMLFLLSSCYFKFRNLPGAAFNNQTTFALPPANPSDKSNTIKELKYQLEMKGFNVISLSSAQKAIDRKGELRGKDKKDEVLEIYSVKDVNSVYAIELGTTYKYDVFDYSYDKFKAHVYDMNSGKTVAWAVTQDKPVKWTIKKFVEKMTKLRLK